MPDQDPAAQRRLAAARIVAAYLRQNQIPADQVGALIGRVDRTLAGLGEPLLEPPREPAVPIRQSVQREYVVCLECGWRGRMLGRHLATRHDLTPEQYRVRWKLRPDHPLTAPAYSERRSALAKQFGFGRRREVPEAEPDAGGGEPKQAAARRRGRPRKSSE